MSKYAVVSISASGDNQIVAAVPNQKIVLLSYTVIAAGAVSITWKSIDFPSASIYPISGPMALAANGGAAPSAGPLAPGAIVGLMETLPGQALCLGLSAAVAVGGHITYRTVAV